MSKILLAAAAVATLIAGSAMAETKSAAVPTGNVNFNSRADVNALVTKVELAAQSVCRYDSKNRYVAQPDRACVEQAVAQIAQYHGEIIGVGRYDRVNETDAEIAFNIRDDYQGKGLGSPGKAPVLKHKVHGWLVQKNEILAFVQARPAEGGAGALVVLLQSATRNTT